MSNNQLEVTQRDIHRAKEIRPIRPTYRTLTDVLLGNPNERVRRRRENTHQGLVTRAYAERIPGIDTENLPPSIAAIINGIHNFLGKLPLLYYRKLSMKLELLVVPEMITARSLDLYTKLLNLTLDRDDIHTYLTSETVNFFQHMAMAILRTNELRPGLIPEDLIANTKRMNWIINANLHVGSMQNLKQRWSTNLALHFEPSDYDYVSQKPIGELQGLNEAIDDVRQTLRVDIRRISPLNSFALTGVQYAKRFDPKNNRTVEEPLDYSRREAGAINLAEQLKREQVKTKIGDVLKIIEKAAPSETTLICIHLDSLYPRIDGMKGSRRGALLKNEKVRSVLQKWDLFQAEKYTLKELSLELNKVYKKLQYLDADSSQSILEMLLNLIEQSTLEERELLYDNAYTPVAQVSLTPEQKKECVHACREYAKDTQKKARESHLYDRIAKIKWWSKLSRFLPLLFLVGMLSSDIYYKSKNLTPEELWAESKMMLADFLTGEWMNTPYGFLPSGFADTLGKYNSSGVFDKVQNTNLPPELINFHENLPAFSIINGKGSRDPFYPIQIAPYHYSIDNPFEILWGENSPFYRFDTTLIPFPFYALSNVPNVTFLDEITDFQTLANFEERDIPLKRDSTYPGFFVEQTVLVDFSTTSRDTALLTVPGGSNFVLIISETATSVTHELSADSIMGTRYLTINKPEASVDQKERRALVYFLYISDIGDYAIANSIKEIANPLPYVDSFPTEVFGTPSAEMISFIDEWGFDYQLLQEQLAERAQAFADETIRSEGYTPEQLDDQDYQRFVRYTVEMQISEIARELIAEQLKSPALNVQYSTDEVVNDFLTSQDLRSYFIVAKAVGLDCDGMVLLSNSILHSYIQSPENRLSVNIEGQVDRYLVDITIGNFVPALVIGESDANGDGKFAGYTSHARAPRNSYIYDSLEVTSNFSINPGATPEQMQEIIEQFENYGIRSDFTERARAVVYRAWILSTLFGIPSALYMTKMGIKGVHALAMGAHLLAKGIGNARSKLKETFNGRLVTRLIPKLNLLDDKQLTQLIEMMLYMNDKLFIQQKSPLEHDAESNSAAPPAQAQIVTLLKVFKSYSGRSGGSSFHDFSSFKHNVTLLSMTHNLSKAQVSRAIEAISILQEIQRHKNSESTNGNKQLSASKLSSIYRNYPLLENMEISEEFLQILDALKMILRFKFL